MDIFQEMYEYLFGSTFEGQHRALYDCMACLMCFEKMVKDEENEINNLK